MLRFSDSTKYGKTVPKEAFYRHMTLNSKTKESFVRDIKKIVWANKLSHTNMNIEAGSSVKEIEIFEIELKNDSIDYGTIEAIAKQVPQKIVFVLKYEGRAQLCIYLKKLHMTVWQPENMLVLNIVGMDLDKVWDNFVLQISGLREEPGTAGAEEAVERDIERRKLQKKIDALRRKMANEKQFNRKIKLRKEIAELTQQLK